MPENFRRKISAVTAVFTALLAFLLPLKFGGMAVMPESGGFYPEDIFSWFYVTFPPHALGIAGAVILAAALLSGVRRQISRRMTFFIILWCVIPLCAALPGAIRGYPGETLGELANLAGIGAFSAAAALLTAEKPRRGKFFAGSFLAGGILCAVNGIYQHFAGLDELRAFVAEQIQLGVEIPEALQLKMADPRIFSTMASSNALASLLLMLIPLAVCFARSWGKYFEPEKVSRTFFTVLFPGIIVTALFMTSSRSAVFCPAATAAVAFLSYPRLKKVLRFAGIAALMLLLAGALLWVTYFGRGTASMVERADYLRSAAIITAEHPLAGGGWGSFFRTHMTIKLSGTDEAARDPHNVIAAFASQAGVFSALAISAVLLLPLAMLWKHRFTPGFPMAVFWSGVLFTLHSLLDCDWHIPALPAAMGMLYAAAVAETAPADAPETNFRLKWISALCLLLLAGASLRLNVKYLAGDHALSRLYDRLSPASAEMAQKNRHLDVNMLADKVISARPGDAIPWMMLGNHYITVRQLDKAEDCFEKAAALDPLRPGIWSKLAFIALWQNRKSDAEKLMLKAQRIFPKNPRYNVQKFLSGGEK